MKHLLSPTLVFLLLVIPAHLEGGLTRDIFHVLDEVQ